ncbi:MAG: YD repeat-containing protein, partial [Myxococcota bacterium]
AALATLRTVDFDYVLSGDLLVDSLLSRETTSPDIDDDTPQVVEHIDYAYDAGPIGSTPTLGLLTLEQACSGELGAICAATESWVYDRDARGVIVWMETPGGAITHNVALALGGALIIDHRNAFGWPTTSTYDGFGRGLVSTDPNGVATRTERDTLGRPIAQFVTGKLNPEYRTAEWEHHSTSVPHYTREDAFIASFPGDTPAPISSYSVLDGLGREVQRWSPANDLTGFTVVDTYTNLAGDLRYTSEPYGEDAFADTLVGAWDRDHAQRNYPDGLGVVRRLFVPHTGWNVLSRPESGVQLSVDANSYERWSGEDVHGRLLWVEEGDTDLGPVQRTAEYDYDGRDRVRRFTDANGNAYQYDFDGAGRLARALRRGTGSASFSLWKAYTYVGPWPLEQLDPDGPDADAEPDVAVRWTIDPLGRPIAKDVAQDGGMATYTWSWSDTWRGALHNRVDPWGTLSRTYDEGSVFGLGHMVSETRIWNDAASKTWTTERDSAGRAVETTWPGGATVTQHHAPLTGWLLAQSLDAPGLSYTVTYDPGSFGEAHDGWSVPLQSGSIDYDLTRFVPGRIDAVSLDGPHGIDKVLYPHDPAGRLASRVYDRSGLTAQYYYTYDPLGRLATITEAGGSSPAEAYSYDALGVPTSLASGSYDWEYDPAPQFGEVPKRRQPGTIAEHFGWDASTGRMAWMGHWTPAETYRQTYSYDGAGRLSGVVQSLPMGAELWRHELGYDAANQRVWEQHSEAGSVTRQVWRHGGYEYDSDVGETLQVLPMARLVDGDLRWIAHEPDGRAPYVYAEDGTLVAYEVLGATGERLSSTGAVPWHQDSLHGAQIDRGLGLVHHGVRHARLSDGLWMQPEPLLFLGVQGGQIAAPQAFGPVYAAGNTNVTMDRSGMIAPLLVFLAKEVATEAVVQAAYHYGGDKVGMAVEVGSMFTSPTQAVKGAGKQLLKRGGKEMLQAAATKAVTLADDAVTAVKRCFCFVEGTEVQLVVGPVAIEDVRRADRVLADGEVDATDGAPLAELAPIAPLSPRGPLCASVAAAASSISVPAAVLEACDLAPPPAEHDAVLAYDARTGTWQESLAADLPTGTDVLHAGHLFHGSPDAWLDRGPASIDTLAPSDAVVAHVHHLDALASDTWVLQLGPDAHHRRLANVPDKVPFAVQARVYTRSGEQVTWTGLVVDRVVRPHNRLVPEVLALTLQTADGEHEVTATPEHPFWVPSRAEWVHLQDLEPGADLLTATPSGGAELPFLAVSLRSRPVKQ